MASLKKSPEKNPGNKQRGLTERFLAVAKLRMGGLHPQQDLTFLCAVSPLQCFPWSMPNGISAISLTTLPVGPAQWRFICLPSLVPHGPCLLAFHPSAPPCSSRAVPILPAVLLMGEAQSCFTGLPHHVPHGLCAVVFCLLPFLLSLLPFPQGPCLVTFPHHVPRGLCLVEFPSIISPLLLACRF